MEQSIIRHPKEAFSVILPYQTKKDVINIFMKCYVENGYYKESMNTISLRDGLLEFFSRDGHDSFYTEEGEWKPHIREMTPAERDLYLYYHLKRNAYAFWRETPEIAEEFVEKHLGTLNNKERPPAFSPTFYCTTLKMLIGKKEWEQFIHVFGPGVGTPNYQFIFKL